MAEASDYELLDRYAGGDEPAFEELVRRHQKTIYGLAYRMLDNHADAADMAQATLLVLRIYHDRAFAEIGTIMSCSEGTAKANYHHAVSKLRRVLVADEGTP